MKSYLQEFCLEGYDKNLAARLFEDISRHGFENNCRVVEVFVPEMNEPYRSLLKTATIVTGPEFTLNWFGAQFKVTPKQSVKDGFVLVLFESANAT